MENKWKIIAICAFLLLGSVFAGCIENNDSKDDPDDDNGNPPNGNNQTTIEIASGEWGPFVSEELLHEGVVSRVVRESFEVEGYEVTFKYRPWNRSLEETKSGKWHGTLPWLKNEEREKDFYFSEPIAYQTYVVFHKKDQVFTWDAISDLEGYTIGGTDGYSYGAEFDKAIEDGLITMERTTSDDQNFEKLLADRVDLVLCEINVGYDIIDKLSSADANKISHAPKTVNAEPLYLLLSKQVEGNDDLIKSFNSGLLSLTQNGKVEQYWDESRNGDYKI